MERGTFSSDTDNDTSMRLETAFNEARQGICHSRLLSASEMRQSLQQALCHWNGRDDCWVFAYGSLIWKPAFDYAQAQRMKVYGYHRRLCLWSHINRGSQTQPGLVLALDRGGSCSGLGLRIRAEEVVDAFAHLWAREMFTGAYQPIWLNLFDDRDQTGSQVVKALTFVARRDLPSYAGRLDDTQLRPIVQQARGRCGTTADYITHTAQSLAKLGIVDQHLSHMVSLL